MKKNSRRNKVFTINSLFGAAVTTKKVVRIDFKNTILHMPGDRPDFVYERGSFGIEVEDYRKAIDYCVDRLISGHKLVLDRSGIAWNGFEQDELNDLLSLIRDRYYEELDHSIGQLILNQNPADKFEEAFLEEYNFAETLPKDTRDALQKDLFDLCKLYYKDREAGLDEWAFSFMCARPE